MKRYQSTSMAGTKAIITVVLEPKLLAALTVEAAKARRSRNAYINLLLEQRHDNKKETEK